MARSRLPHWVALGAFALASFSCRCDSNGDSPGVAEIQAMLDSMAANGRVDTVSIPAGQYDVRTTLEYHSDEAFALLIVGAGETVLDGGNETQTMSLSTTAPGADVTVRGIAFQNGDAELYGGGLMIQTEEGDIVVDTCVFAANHADTLGGGAHLTSNNGDVTIARCVFADNVSDLDGGGLNASSTCGLVILTTSTFTNNRAMGDDAGGALLYTENGELLMTYNTFSGNAALGDGGAGGGGGFTYLMGTDVSVEVSHNTFTNNQSYLDGGGAFTRVNGSGSVIYADNVFSGNSAQTYNGGACQIHLNDGTLSYTGNSHADNTSGGDGGALWIWNGWGTLDISDNVFADNSTTDNGGGAGVVADSGTLELHHNVFSGNEAGNVGGGAAISTTAGTLNVYHNTCYSNVAPGGGGGFYFHYDAARGATECYNNILWQDTPDGIAQSGAMMMTATYSDVDNGTGQPWFGVGCIEADPLFESAASGDFHLTGASPCIDAGDPASALDPDGTQADMGAFYFPQ